MAKPPKSTPHSDIDGVHQDEKPNVVTAQETGETAANLELARGQAKGKPPHSEDDGKGGARDEGGGGEGAAGARR